MKVLLVNGSPHEKGNTAIALNEVAGVLRAEGIDSEVFWIGTKPVRGCSGCGACRAGDRGKCVFGDDVCNELSGRMECADGIVIGSPTYYGQPAGQLLAVMQRALFSNPRAAACKPVASVAICRRGGASAAFQCMNLPFQMLDCIVVGSQYWNIAYGRTPGEAARDEEGMQTMRTLARNMAWVLKNIRRDGAIQRSPDEEWRPTHFIR